MEKDGELLILRRWRVLWRILGLWNGKQTDQVIKLHLLLALSKRGSLTGHPKFVGICKNRNRAFLKKTLRRPFGPNLQKSVSTQHFKPTFQFLSKISPKARFEYLCRLLFHDHYRQKLNLLLGNPT